MIYDLICKRCNSSFEAKSKCAKYCSDCKVIVNRETKARHARTDKSKKKNREYYLSNKEKRDAEIKAWHKKHLERVKEIKKKSYEKIKRENPELLKEQRRKAFEKVKNNPVKYFVAKQKSIIRQASLPARKLSREEKDRFNKRRQEWRKENGKYENLQKRLFRQINTWLPISEIRENFDKYNEIHKEMVI